MSHYQPHVVEVGNCSYLIQHPDPEAGWEIGIELVKLVGEPAANIAQGAMEGGAEKAASGLADAVRSFLTKLEPKQSFAMAKKILRTVELQSVDGENKKMAFSNESYLKMHFTGRLGELVEVLAETIAYTHVDFSKAIMDRIAKAMAEAGKRE